MAMLPSILLLLAGTSLAADDVLVLTTAGWDQHLTDTKHTLVEFYAPWCGHCKKLLPEYEKAAAELKDKGVKLGKVDATEEKELSTRYSIKGFPTMVWFEDGKETEYDGGRTADTIVEWVNSMIGPPIFIEGPGVVVEPNETKPAIVLHSESLSPGFEAAAKANRRKASWHFAQEAGASKILLHHKGEEPVEFATDIGDMEKVTQFLLDNAFPMFGKLDADTFDKYMEAGKGMVWSLFPNEEDGFEGIERKYRPMMAEVAKQFRGRFFVTFTNTEKFKEAVENMLSITEFPAIAVQKKAGDKKKYVYTAEMTAEKIAAFIADVEAGKVEPKLKSEPEPPPSDDPVRISVASTLEQDLFSPDKDVMLEVYAPWCGHCKKLEPEYSKLAKKIKKEELTDLISIAKIDGVANDSPIESVDWSGFPTIFFVKAGTTEPIVYDGERTAKSLWKYVKKHATKAAEIRERLERRKAGQAKSEEL